MTVTFRCRTCDQEHIGLPVFGPDAPAAYSALDEPARADALLGSEQCELGERRFLRARLTIPLTDRHETFAWLVWVELSALDHERAIELWEQEGREREPPMSGTLAVALPFYPSTEGLKVELRTMPVGERPEARVTVEHPLRSEQTAGIPVAEAVRRAEALLHDGDEDTVLAPRGVFDAFHARFGEEDDGIRFDGRDATSPPPVPLVDVLIWRPSDSRGLTTFVTLGMAAQPMPSSAMRAELQMTIRDVWGPDSERSIAMFLANLCCYAWDIGAALDHWRTVGNVGAVPLFPGCTAVLLRPPLVGPEDDISTRSGPVRVLQVMPITQQERTLGRDGRAAIDAYFRSKGIDPFCDRPA
ncbi:MAG: DUF2199 domain-containing protein [Myxococcota bacterium]|nr:DUF2199 domain-containing protein [Myxococcota bacterium]